MRKGFYIIFCCCLIVLIAGCSVNEEAVVSNSSISTLQDTQNPIPVYFEKYEDTNTKVESIDIRKLGKTLSEKSVDSKKISIAEMYEDQEYLHAILITSDKLFDLGPVSMKNLSNSNTDSIAIHTTYLNNNKLIRLEGSLGLNYPQTKYFIINDNIPALLLKIDGHTNEIDLDGDGYNEVISSSGTPTITQVYKVEKNNIKIADINKTLNNAISVIYENNTFSAYYKDQPNIPKYYKYTAKGFTLTNN